MKLKWWIREYPADIYDQTVFRWHLGSGRNEDGTLESCNTFNWGFEAKQAANEWLKENHIDAEYVE
jgi:hypothetical protein